MRAFMAGLAVLFVLISMTGCDSQSFQATADRLKDSWAESKAPPKDGADKLADEVMSDVTAQVPKEKLAVKLYFANGEGKLAIEERKIEKEEGIGRATLGELLKGPKQKGLKRVLPENLAVHAVNVKPDGRCIVDLSQELQDVMGTANERLAIYSIVDTISQFPSVDNVTFLVNGEPIRSGISGFDYAKPIEPDYTLAAD